MALEVRVLQVGVSAIRGVRAEVFGAAGLGAKNQVDHLDTTRHWALLVDGEVVGCATVVEVRGLLLRAMAVCPRRQRLGLGAILMTSICEDVAGRMWCNARLPAVPFFVACGWVEESPVFDMRGKGLHQRLAWMSDAVRAC
ncbi:MAG: GNAT superfamily N-acetyltransferase [Myxococcota bacterium]